jgi:hypothetical protein
MSVGVKRTLATLKDPGFQEEREWRVVMVFEPSDSEDVKFRATPMAIVPYREWSFPLDAIRSIRVGPGQYLDVREEGVRRLLESLRSEIPVVRSQIPLRT